MLADRVRARRDVVRADPVTMEEFGHLIAGGSNRSRSGVSVTATRALGLPAWWSGVRYITEAVMFLPWHQFTGPVEGRVRVADPVWRRNPDIDTPWPVLLEHWVVSMLHRGNAYAFKIRDFEGRVVGLRPVHPDRVRTSRASDGTKVHEVKNGADVVPMTSRELLHIPGLSSDGTVGHDVLSVHAEALGIAAASDEFAARSFTGSHLRAYLSLPQALTQDQADDLLEQWRAFHMGVQSADGFGVLGNGAEYKTVSLTPEQVQLLETRTFNVQEIARILRIPPHKLYELSRATFSNIEHQGIEAVVDSVRPWVERVETAINYDPDLNPSGTFTEANLEGLLRGDSASRAAFYAAGINGGWLMPQTVAQKENLPAPDELAYYQRPLNVSVIRPGEGSVPDAPTPREIAEIIQKAYLGVGKVITSDEARALANKAGAGLDPVGPPEASALVMGSTPAPEVQV